MSAGERVLQRLQAAEAASAEASVSGGEGVAFHCGSPSAVRAQLAAVRSAHAHVHKLWQHKKMQLDQCFQLRLFEQDCEKVRRGGVVRLAGDSILTAIFDIQY